MKYNKLYILLIFMSVFIGCTDLEEEPQSVYSPEGFFKTANDVEATIFGAYGRMASESYYGRKLTLALQLRGDMCDIGDRGTPARRQHINDFQADPNNGMISAFWPRSYEIISAANTAIHGADLIKDNISETRYNELVAEARFVRAFTYFHLVRLFGDIPYIDYFVTDPEPLKTLEKTAESVVYENIKADLNFAKDNLPGSYPASVRTRPTWGTAYGYLALVNLTLEEWQQAYDNAKHVIDNADALDYRLMDDFQDLFRADMHNGLNEHLFAIDFLGQRNAGGGENDDLMGPITGIRGSDKQGWSVSVPSMEVYNSWDARDYRKKVSFEDSTLVNDTLKPYTEYQRVQRPHIAKFIRYPGNSDVNTRYSDHNYVCMRYAEVLLIAAEALNEVNNGPSAEAEGYINQVRERASMWYGTIDTDYPGAIPTGLSQEAFRDSVIDERRLELAFEFKRWYDIKRKELGTEVFTGPTSLEPHPETWDPERDYKLPIPQDEIDVNQNLLPQNPGY